MNNDNPYIAGVAVRNPSDFTPKSWYAEMDAQAEQHRKWRFRQRIWMFLAYVGFFVGMFLFLKSL